MRIRFPINDNGDVADDAPAGGGCAVCGEPNIVYCGSCGDSHWELRRIGGFIYVRCVTCGLDATELVMKTNEL